MLEALRQFAIYFLKVVADVAIPDYHSRDGKVRAEKRGTGRGTGLSFLSCRETWLFAACAGAMKATFSDVVGVWQ